MRLLAFEARNPGLLPLLLLALLPILLHLLDRRRARQVDWPAMRFLVLGSHARLRRWRLREALLIIVRSLLALLLALVVIGPASRESRPVRQLPEGTRGVVLVIDTSFSMTQTAGRPSSSSLSIAREKALEILDGLRAGDAVALLVGQGGPGSIEQTFSNPTAARMEVMNLGPDGGHFRLVDALDRAAGLLRSLGTPHREVYVFTDLQADIVPDAALDRWVSVERRLRAGGIRPMVTLIDCGGEGSWNRFVAELEPPPLAAGTDTPTRFRILTGSSGSTPGGGEGPHGVRLLVDGLEVASTEDVPPPGEPRTISYRFRKGGRVRVTAELPRDGLPVDDTRYLALEVLEEIPLLIVGSAGREPGRPLSVSRADRTSAEYLDLALAPRAPGIAEPAVIFKTDFVTEIDSRDLSDFRGVVLAGVRRITREQATRLESFVRGGGALLVFLHPELDVPGWAELLFRGGHGLLPGRPLPGDGRAPEGLHPQEVLLSHPAISVFRGGENGDLSRITIRRWRRLGPLSPDTVVLARIREAAPWIVERGFGAGRVLVMTTSATPEDSDLTRTTLFVPLVHRLARYLAAGNRETAAARTGEALSLPLPGGLPAGEVVVRDPSDSETLLVPKMIDGELRATFTDTRVPGFYTLGPRDPADGPSTLFAVNIPAEESAIERVPPGVVAALTTTPGVEIVRPAALTPGKMVIQAVLVDHRTALLAAAIALAVLEILIAGRFAGGRG